MGIALSLKGSNSADCPTYALPLDLPCFVSPIDKTTQNEVILFA